MAAIFQSSLQNLRPLPARLKVKPLFKHKTGFNFFVNTAKTKTKVSVNFSVKVKTKDSTLSLSSG